jgi:hypothetical protein
MKEQQNYRRIDLRFGLGEYAQLMEQSKKTSCRSIAEYGRKLILKGPIIVNHRNQSMDESMELLIELKNELHQIAINSMKALEQLEQARDLPDYASWVSSFQQIQESLLSPIRQINEHISSMAELWLQ